MSKCAWYVALAATFPLAVAGALPAAAQGGYKLIKTINLPGSQGGHGDWVSFDPATSTVWLSQSPDHNVVVINAKTNTVEGVIPGVEDGNGNAVGPTYAYLSDNKGNVTEVVNKRTLKKVATLHPDGKGPNGTIYDPSNGDVYVSTDSDDMTVFSGTPPFKKIGNVQLQPHPAKDGPDVGLFVPEKGRIYQPVDNVVDVIDPATNKVVSVWKPGIEHSAKPIVYDAKTNHLVLGTTDHKMLVLNADTGQVVASIPVKGAVDETVIDPGARRAYVGDKAGLIEVINLDTNKVVDTIPSEAKVHTLAVDPATGDVYVYRNVSNKVDVFHQES